MTEQEEHIVDEHMEKQLETVLTQQSSSWNHFFIKRFRMTYLMMAVIILLGVYAMMTLPKEAEPEVSVPFVMITVPYPGANPVDVEDLIVDEIEEKIKNIDNVKAYNATAGVGYASISVEFEAEADIDKSLADVKDAVDEVAPFLPEDAEEPVVKELNFNDIAIVTYSFVGDYNDVQMREFAQVLQDEFERMPDVSRAPIVGEIMPEYQILVDQNKLDLYGVSLAQVAQAIRLSNMNAPSGDIAIDGYEYSVRVQGKFTRIDDIKDVIVTYVDEAPVYVRDIATIQDGFKEQETSARIGIGQSASKNTVSVQIYKRTGGNILRIVDNAESVIAELEDSAVFPADVSMLKTNDNSVYIKEDISRLGKSGGQTMILIILFLLVVLGLRGSLITGFSVPIAFLIAFIFIMFQGMTINSMVLFSLVLSLGLMVDNSIIVMEGINEYMDKHGKTAKEAAILAVWNYKWPIIAGTMTTVAAFLPMLLVSGIMGEYMSILPKTVSATLLASLFVALVIIPALASRFYVRHDLSKKKKHPLMKKGREKVEQWKKDYVVALRKILIAKAKRRSIIVSALVLVFVAISLPIVGIMKVEMFPAIDFDYFVVGVTLPTGSSVDKTNARVLEAESIIQSIPELDNYVTTIGAGFSAYAGNSADNGDHTANIMVNLVDKKERDRVSYDIAASVRDELRAIDGADVRVQEMTAGPPTGAPFEARIFGDDLQTLFAVSAEVKRAAGDIDGLINIQDSLDESSGELVFQVDRQKAMYYGLDVSTIANTLRQAIYGVNASTVTVDGEDIDIHVSYTEESIQDADDLGNISLQTQSGQSVMLRQVADVHILPSINEIHHLDGKKVIRITGQLAADGNLRHVMDAFDQYIQQELVLPDGVHIEVGGETEDIQKSFTEIFMSMFVAVFLILFILILQFDSFKKPLIIIFALPLAIVGAFFGLTLLGLAFSLPAFIGLVSLAGIVVNDAIVLIDRIDKNLERRMPFIDGIVEAGLARMQPIFLTSATTIAGIFPLALSEEMWAGLGFSIIFGLLFATGLTLVFIPVLYVSLFQKEYMK
ncbi:efflux RND transporter permease subunit [Patescibacteria group bacterium]|nr:efflux RND transporter permease subunit [Patescibacteria group bacterium]MBU1721844.1 efflux RND transporter permease subunit [Patescibacteria group bacterium]MBU1901661.1 efflux RND transporter permease subunit [Patescibacteria group bacterium]